MNTRYAMIVSRMKQKNSQDLFDKDEKVKRSFIKITEIQQPLLKVNQVQLIQCLKQDESLKAIGFNYTGTVMVAGCGYDLKVWNFQNGSLSEIKTLTGHTYWVHCIVFSKRLNWFASGSEDSTVRCWKEVSKNDWICSNIGQQHKNYVVCLIMNNNEDEIISSSFDNTIIVWNVNCWQNQLEYYYTLEKKHNNYIYCIHMNESETYLVSCSQDTQIQNWFYRQLLRISQIYQVDNKQLKRRPELNIELNKEIDDNWLFPTIFNQQKQIIIQKHNKYVYILQKHEDGKLSLAYEPIDCDHKINFGALTIDGGYLVIWNSKSKEIKVYNIKYK